MGIAPQSVIIQQVADLAQVATKTGQRLLEYELILRNSTAPPSRGQG